VLLGALAKARWVKKEVVPGDGKKKKTRTVDVYCPYRAVVSVVGTETLSIMREPDVDDVIFRA
jgi:hypothetical protein